MKPHHMIIFGSPGEPMQSRCCCHQLAHFVTAVALAASRWLCCSFQGCVKIVSIVNFFFTCVLGIIYQCLEERTGHLVHQHIDELHIFNIIFLHSRFCTP
jgi:hypothetical protein